MAMGFQRAIGERGDNLCGVRLGVTISQGRKREIGHRGAAVEEFIPLSVHLVVVERLKNPVIFSLETHLAGITPQALKEFDNLKAFRRRFQLVAER
jgi:hypothetical protein